MWHLRAVTYAIFISVRTSQVVVTRVQSIKLTWLGFECSGPFLGAFDHTRSVPSFRKAALKITPSSRRSRTFCVVSQLEAWRFTFGAVYDLADCRSLHGDPIQQTPKMLDPSLHLHESFP